MRGQSFRHFRKQLLNIYKTSGSPAYTGICCTRFCFAIFFKALCLDLSVSRSFRFCMLYFNNFFLLSNEVSLIRQRPSYNIVRSPSSDFALLNSHILLYDFPSVPQTGSFEEQPQSMAWIVCINEIRITLTEKLRRNKYLFNISLLIIKMFSLIGSFV